MPKLARPHVRWIAPALALLALFAARAVCAGPAGGEPALRFVRDGREVSVLTLSELVACCDPREVVVDDPYYAASKRFRAVPLRDVLARGFRDGALGGFPEAEVLLRARDGYTRTASGAQLLADGGFLAFGDAEHPSGDFFPIDRRQVDPAPFYLVWKGPGRTDTHVWPWPYQLVEIEITDFARQFPHVAPPGAAPGSAAARGFAIFRRECFACHAINGEGGRVGPELNVPQSIVEYRPAEQIKAFVREPASFRYTSMPAHAHLTDADLDALIAYFRFMSAHKHDPARSPGH